jgi:hypothetical protein
MILFIESEPFTIEPSDSDPTVQRVEIRLRVALTEPTAEAPAQPSASLDFVLDTGSDYASVYPENLDTFGIPQEGPSGGWLEVRTIGNQMIQAPTRDVILWLYSNMADKESRPYPVYLSHGVIVLPGPSAQTDPSEGAWRTHSADPRPLLGMNPLLDAGLRIELDARAGRFSAWVPPELY